MVAEQGRHREALIPILQALQAEYRYLPREALERDPGNLQAIKARGRCLLRTGKPHEAAALLQKAKPILIKRGPRGRAYLGGLLTTWSRS